MPLVTDPQVGVGAPECGWVRLQGCSALLSCVRRCCPRCPPQDAIIRVTSTCICGSDLHLYVGAMPGMKRGDIVGHEFM